MPLEFDTLAALAGENASELSPNLSNWRFHFKPSDELVT